MLQEFIHFTHFVTIYKKIMCSKILMPPVAFQSWLMFHRNWSQCTLNSVYPESSLLKKLFYAIFLRKLPLWATRATRANRDIRAITATRATRATRAICYQGY